MSASDISTDDVLWPSFGGPSQLAAVERVALGDRGLPASTYELVRRAAELWPDRPAVSVLPDAESFHTPLVRTFAELAGDVHRRAGADELPMVEPRGAEREHRRRRREPRPRRRRFLYDVTRSPRLPASVDVSKFEVGGTLAVTPGSVVLRSDVSELIQYRPATREVHEVPLLFVPPTINKYYILDLSPGRSLVEWLLGQQQQVFTISWRNPDAAQGHFDLDTYAQAVLDARDGVTDDPDRGADEWVQAQDVTRGSWWPDYQNWLTRRAGKLKPAPKALGSCKHQATAKAPGGYVHAS